jgi:hypothetical protein
MLPTTLRRHALIALALLAAAAAASSSATTPAAVVSAIEACGAGGERGNNFVFDAHLHLTSRTPQQEPPNPQAPTPFPCPVPPTRQTKAQRTEPETNAPS